VYLTGSLVISNVVSLGVIAPGYVLSMFVRNMNSQRVWIEDIVFSSDIVFEQSGLTIGMMMLPYEKKAFTLTLKNTSPVNIDFTFGLVTNLNDDEHQLAISGATGIFVADRPETGVVETIEFLTDVQTSANGSELRISLREAPRIGVSLSMSRMNLSRLWHQILYATSSRLIVLPKWWEELVVTAVPVVGSNLIMVDTSKTSFSAGAPCVLDGPEGSDLLLVESVEADRLITTTPITVSYSEAPMGCPALLGYSQDQATSSRYSSEARKVEVSFLSALAPDVEGFVADVEYKSLPVFTRCNLFKDDSVKIASQNGGHLLDYDAGTFFYDDFWGYAKPTIDVGIHATTKDDAWWLRQLLGYLRGQKNLIWVPTNSHDLFLVNDLGGTTITLVVENHWYTNAVFNNRILRYVQITDGASVVYREIVGAEETSPDEEQLTLDATVNFTGPVKISFLLKCRLASDKVELEWTRDNEAFCILPMIGVLA